MAFSKEAAAAKVLSLIEQNRIGLDGDEIHKFKKCGEAEINGFRCKIVNVLSLSSCKVLVNTQWFSSEWPDYSRPHMKSIQNSHIDYQLIPSNSKLFALHFLDLRHYALFLEKDRDHWFRQSYWGIRIREDEDCFVWEGGNHLSFPLLVVTSGSVLAKRNQQITKSLREF